MSGLLNTCSGTGDSDWMQTSWPWWCCCYIDNQEFIADGIHQLVCQWTCMHKHVWELFHPNQSPIADGIHQLVCQWTCMHKHVWELFHPNQSPIADGIHQLVCQWTCMHKHVWELFHPNQSPIDFHLDNSHTSRKGKM